MLIALLNILFHIIIINFIIKLLGRFNILLIFINKFLKLVRLILNKSIDNIEN